MTYEVRQFGIVAREPIDRYTVTGGPDMVEKALKERLRVGGYALVDWHAYEESLHIIFFYQIKAYMERGKLAMTLESATHRKTLG
jgi:hypothetical protein